MNPISMKLVAAAAGASFLLGTFGGGFAVHKLWWGKTQSEKLELSQGSLKSVQDELADSKRLAKTSADKAAEEADARKATEARLSQAYDDNARLAQSRASTTTHYIKEGEEIGKALKDDYPCVYEPWPRQLRDYSFGSSDIEDLSRSLIGGYPSSK